LVREGADNTIARRMPGILAVFTVVVRDLHLPGQKRQQ
jgi:hypothetical protein